MTTELKLTAKQEKFCQGIAEGKTQYQAYLEAYTVEPTTGREVVDVTASRLMDDTKIALRVKELKEPAEAALRLTIQKRHEILYQLATDDKVRPRDRLNSIDITNKMDRLYSESPQQQAGNTINIIAYSPETKRLVDSFLNRQDTDVPQLTNGTDS